MKKILGIYGAGGLGREVLELARIINRAAEYWDGFLFIVDGEAKETVNGIKVYSYAEAKETYGDRLQAVIGIGEPAVRDLIFHRLREDGINLVSLVHPDVYIPDTTEIGEGTVITTGCCISCDVTIGDNCYIQPHSCIGHDCVIEEGCVVYGKIAGNVHIGKYTYIGMGSCVKEAVNIGEYVIVGMSSAVFYEIPSEAIAVGNPARQVKKNVQKRVFDH